MSADHTAGTRFRDPAVRPVEESDITAIIELFRLTKDAEPDVSINFLSPM